MNTQAFFEDLVDSMRRNRIVPGGTEHQFASFVLETVQNARTLARASSAAARPR